MRRPRFVGTCTCTKSDHLRDMTPSVPLMVSSRCIRPSRRACVLSAQTRDTHNHTDTHKRIGVSICTFVLVKQVPEPPPPPPPHSLPLLHPPPHLPPLPRLTLPHPLHPHHVENLAHFRIRPTPTTLVMQLAFFFGREPALGTRERVLLVLPVQMNKY